MPVDYCVCLLPLLFFAALIPALTATNRKPWRIAAVSLLSVFLLMYVLPGWFFWIFAQAGNREAQYQMSRLRPLGGGHFWSEIEARDRWLLEAAKQGHPQAMSEAGYFSTFGTSQYLPKNLSQARQWLESAKAAGCPSEVGFRLLAEAEAKDQNSK